MEEAAETAQGFVEVDNGRLYYEEAGKGAPVLLVHGFALDTRMWDDQWAALSRHYRVIRYDVRGYGRSTMPADGEPYSHMEDLRAVLDKTAGEPAHIVALSLGGAISLEFVLRYPAMARTLTLVDSVLWGADWSPDEGALYQAIWHAGRGESVQAARELWLKHILFTPALEQPTVAARLHEMTAAYSGWHWTHNDQGYYPRKPAAHRLSEISVPTFVVVGERDTPDLLAVADKLAREIPGAQKAVMRGVGHMANMEDPARFNSLLLDFLERAGR